VVFVEVKTRGCGSPARPEDFVHRRQLARLRRVASRWLAAYPGSYAGCRLDVVAVEFSGPDRGLRLRHFRDVG
jgi:putative endonuclease